MAPLQQSMTTHNCTIPSKCPVPSKTVDEESEQQTSSIAGCQKYRDIEGHNGVFMWHTCETRGDDFLGVQAGYMGHCPEILWRNVNKQSLWASCRTLQSCVPTTWESHMSHIHVSTTFPYQQPNQAWFSLFSLSIEHLASQSRLDGRNIGNNRNRVDGASSHAPLDGWRLKVKVNLERIAKWPQSLKNKYRALISTVIRESRSSVGRCKASTTVVELKPIAMGQNSECCIIVYLPRIVISWWSLLSNNMAKESRVGGDRFGSCGQG